MSMDSPLQGDVDADAVDETFDDDGVLYDEDVTPQHGILGFTLRELLIVGAWLVLFVVSFVPLGWSSALWSQGIAWILPVGVPTVATFLIVLRRFSPDGIRRVGSLGIDQFASVAFTVSAVWWAQLAWDYVSVVVTTGLDAVVWVPWVALAASLALVVFTVFAPLVPGLREDFQGRLVTLAHRSANPARPVIARPVVVPASDTAADAPAQTDLDTDAPDAFATDEVTRLDLAEQVPLVAHASGGGTGTEDSIVDDEYVPSYSRRSRGAEQEIVSDTGSIESLLQTAARVEAQEADDVELDDDALDADLDATNPRDTAAEPFWILAPTERDVHDERGDVLFRIGPGAWTLVLEDRDGAYVVRHDDGRIGYLHDISDITKG